MTIVTRKDYFNDSSHYREKRKTELYRLITVLGSQRTFAVCERLSDEVSTSDCRSFKGDMFCIDLNYLRVVHTSTQEEDEEEREKYLKELKLLIKE